MKTNHVVLALGFIFESIILTGCGLTSHISAPPSSKPSNASSGETVSSGSSLPTTTATPSGSPGSPSTSNTASTAPTSATPSASAFPPLIASALHSLIGTVGAPLWGPTVLPRGNSATTSASGNAFTVRIFACPTAEPLNSPNIGQMNCGAMASFAESFSATVYYNSSAAMDALPEAAPIPGLSHLNSVPYSLPGGLVAQRWVSNGAGGTGSTIAIRWHEGDWTMWVFGGTSLRNTATSITTDLQQYRLPPFPGVLSVDAAPDGQHSNLAWTTGDVVYQVGAMHQVVHAIEMAASMKYYAQG